MPGGRPKQRKAPREERFSFWLGLALGQVRQDAGLSREIIAGLLDTTAKSVGDWETAKNRPENLERVVQAYAFAAGYPPDRDGRHILRDAAEAFVRHGAFVPFEPPEEKALDGKGGLVDKLGTVAKKRLKET